LYYLNSRYYNPEIGRFINADGLVGQPGEILSHNIYAYCGNNPVMNIDPSGYFWDTVIDVISVGWSLYDFIKDPSWSNAGWLALDVVFAAVPFLTGSRLIKSASKLDDISDVAGYVNKYDDVYDTIVLGNDMGRVTSMAMDCGGLVYNGYKPLNALYAMGKIDEITDSMRYAAKLDNARFVIDKYHAGYKILHVGRDTRSVMAMMKSAYGMELKILYRLQYGNKIHKAWWGMNTGRRLIW
jgi:hypothetical protein